MSRKKLLSLAGSAIALLVLGVAVFIAWPSTPSSAQDFIEALKSEGYECQDQPSKTVYSASCGEAHAAYFKTWDHVLDYQQSWLDTTREFAQYPHYGNRTPEALGGSEAPLWEVICTSRVCAKAAEAAGWKDIRVVKLGDPWKS
ncbi:hypothetical protein [Nonomuraea sp. NPDC049129]|uniref:hypothetical protein n=1 Tax=Nonomuraea sp. NPDC049129 TaxID=3155272 RepID=UPI0033C59D46